MGCPCQQNLNDQSYPGMASKRFVHTINDDIVEGTTTQINPDPNYKAYYNTDFSSKSIEIEAPKVAAPTSKSLDADIKIKNPVSPVNQPVQESFISKNKWWLIAGAGIVGYFLVKK